MARKVDLEMRGRAKSVWFCPFCQVPHPDHPRGAIRCTSCSAVVEMADMTVVVSGGARKLYRSEDQLLQRAVPAVGRGEAALNQQSRLHHPILVREIRPRRTEAEDSLVVADDALDQVA